MVEKKERISVFIDGSNLYYSLQDLGISKIDFQKLVNILKKDRLLVSVFYYNAPLIRFFPEDEFVRKLLVFCSIKYKLL